MTLEELRSELQGFDNDISYFAKRFRAMQSDIRLTLQRLGEIEDGETVEVVGLGDGVVCGRVGSLADGAVFRIDAAALCELLDDDTFAAYLPDGVSVAQKGTKWIVADGARAGKVVLGKDGEVDEAKPGANPSGLRLAYRAKDGSFSGLFKAYVLYRGKPKATTVMVGGVVIDGVGYGTATIRKVGLLFVRIE